MSLIPNRSPFWTLITLAIPSGQAVTQDFYHADNGAAAVEASNLGFRGLKGRSDGDWTAADLVIETALVGDTDWQTERDDTGAVARAIVNALTTGGFSIIFPAGAAWSAGAMPHVRLRSCNSASEANVNQGGTRTITIALLR